MPPSLPESGARPLFALAAGEDSGDLLGADLIKALRARYPDARFGGIGGPRMRAVGFEAWHDVAELSVMGLAEVLRHLPRLLRLRAALAHRLVALRPDAFIGIDAPDFNLGLEARLKRAGIPTVHYVSPAVWAWREGRAARIARSTDCVLCLFPMEPAIYARHGVSARFVGHPLADRFPLVPDRDAARHDLALAPDAPVLAVLPGSRGSEVHRLGRIFVQAATRVAAAIPRLQIVVPVANPCCRAALEGVSLPPGTRLIDGHAQRAMIAADVVLLASGTAALEGMLAKRPLVVGYRIAPLTYALVKGLGMLKTGLYSLPNILAGAALVPERMQRDCTPDRLADDVLAWFHDAARCAALTREFERLHLALHAGGGAAAAAGRAIGQVLATHEGPSIRP
ncbi:MAG TPA: lipid-A-disaccharide synthase [Rhodanobacteraceae bacterium]|nr:lipid-A-disaccharide synthase [Rhodanobacteraceae bacterium]